MTARERLVEIIIAAFPNRVDIDGFAVADAILFDKSLIKAIVKEYKKTLPTVDEMQGIMNADELDEAIMYAADNADTHVTSLAGITMCDDSDIPVVEVQYLLDAMDKLRAELERAKNPRYRCLTCKKLLKNYQIHRVHSNCGGTVITELEE